MNLSSTTTSNKALVLNKRLDSVDTIINCALGILEKRMGGATENDGSELVLVLISTEDGDTGAGNLLYGNLISITKFLWGGSAELDNSNSTN